MKKGLITGSAGLIGSEAVSYFIERGFTVFGIDNDMRKYFFGPEASTIWNRKRLEKTYKDKYRHIDVDIRDSGGIEKLFKDNQFNLVIHAAAQPSHDWAAKEPITDFTINANGTLNLLENVRKYSPDSVFMFISSNKVYGDNPNKLPLIEKQTRYEVQNTHMYFKNGIDESMSIDNALHSLMGASKLAADILVQEYGKYFNLKTGVFRGGVLTGPTHSAAQMHGFLAYLVKCVVTGEEYKIFGYKGKQVRDVIHSYDLITALHEFYKKPRRGEVYNIGGSRHSNVSILEAIKKIEMIANKKASTQYVDKNRKGDHIWYISDVSKFKQHFPNWSYTYTLDEIIEDICRRGNFISA